MVGLVIGYLTVFKPVNHYLGEGERGREGERERGRERNVYSATPPPPNKNNSQTNRKTRGSSNKVAIIMILQLLLVSPWKLIALVSLIHPKRWLKVKCINQKHGVCLRYI